jgi:streptogramin lyase
LTAVAGTVNDLTADAAGNLYFCTEQKDVGQIVTSIPNVTILATAATGPFANALRGIVISPAGDISVVDQIGDIYKLTGGATPASKVYADLYMIADPTDLLIDASGNYVVASQTPTSGSKAINWVSPDGQRWAYYVVKHSPIAIAYDPVTGNLLMADSGNGGTLRLVNTTDESHPVTPLDTTTAYGHTAANNDGDMAVESTGHVLVASNGKLVRFNRTLGTSSVLLSGLGTVRALAIAASSGKIASATGYSAYIAVGSNPTIIHEFPNVDGPTVTIGPSLGVVPNRGTQVPVFPGINVFKMIADDNYDLLVGGDLWGSSPSIKRINTTSLALTTVANQTNGLSSRIEGLVIAPDRSIYALTNYGVVHRVTESPLQVTTVFSDPSNMISIGEDLVLDRSGDLYIAAYQGYGSGYVTKVSGGVASYSAFVQEPRGLLADATNGKLLVTEWVNVGFNGKMTSFDPVSNAMTPVAGFEGMNYSNGGVWADGDIVMDVEGNIYTCSEDDFSVHRFNRNTGKLVRIASGYLNHPSGVAIAKSTPTSGSTTGWSLFVSEYNYIWEIPGVAAPMPQLLDRGAPGTGRVVGYFAPSSGVPREIVNDPAGGGFYVSFSSSVVERMSTTGVRTPVAGPGQGLSGDLTGLTVKSTGTLVVANRSGSIWEIDPVNGYAVSLIYNNPNSTIFDVRSILCDGQNRILIFDRPNAGLSPNCGKVFMLDNGNLSFVSYTNRGYRAAIDPLTADVFVSEQGNAADGGGEILRINTAVTPAIVGHYKGNEFYMLKTGTLDGGLAFDGSGNMYVPITVDGRLYKIDRTTGVKSILSGNYLKPVDTVLAPGTPGTAGAQGTSVFVLDRTAIFEVGVPDLPAGPPPVTNPNFAPPPDLVLQGSMALGGTNIIHINSPGDSNRLYLVVASLSGKVPGFPFDVYLDPSDHRYMPNTPDEVWFSINDPAYMPDFIGYLDASGQSPATLQFTMPNDPAFVFNRFLDFAWIAFDNFSPSGVATVGGTTQLYLGF